MIQINTTTGIFIQHYPRHLLMQTFNSELLDSSTNKLAINSSAQAWPLIYQWHHSSTNRYPLKLICTTIFHKCCLVWSPTYLGPITPPLTSPLISRNAYSQWRHMGYPLVWSPYQGRNHTPFLATWMKNNKISGVQPGKIPGGRPG